MPGHKETANHLRWSWRTALLVFLLALVFRGLHVADVSRHESSRLLYMDEEYNYQWARCLATGEWPAPYDRLRAEPYFRAPLYSHFLAGLILLFGQSLFWIRVVQALIGSVSCSLVYLLGARLFGSRAGLAAGILCALNWVLVYFDATLLLPNLLVLLAVLGFLLLSLASERGSARFAGAAGLVFGLFAITRPNILFFVPCLAVWAWIDRRGGLDGEREPGSRGVADRGTRDPGKGQGAGGRSRRDAVVFTGALLAMFALPPALVTIRNGVTGHDWVVVASQGGVNFFIGNNAESNGMDAVVPGTRATWWGGYDDTYRIAEEAAGTRLKPSEVSSYWTRSALRYITTEPIAWLGLMGRKTLAWMGDAEVPNNEAYEQRRGEYPSLWLPISFGVVLALFLVSLPWQRRPTARRRGLVALVWAFLAAYSVSFLLFFVTGRYRAPLIPFLSLGAGVTVVGAYDLLREGRRRRALLIAAAAIALFVLLRIDWLGVRSGSVWFAQYNAAVEEMDLGRLDAAIARFDKLLERGTTFDPEVYGTIIRAHERRGRPEDAREMTLLSEFALQFHPRNPDFLAYAVRGHARAAEWPAALARAREYTAVAPGDTLGWFTGYRAAMALGRTDEARRVREEAERRFPGSARLLEGRAAPGNAGE